MHERPSIPPPMMPPPQSALRAQFGTRYELRRVLGKGGMGVVYEAFDHTLGREIAIKQLLCPPNSQARARFQREARAGAALTSMHATRVFDVGELADGSPFIVMEMLHGADLAQALKSGVRFSEPEAIDLVLQAAAALAEAHRLGVVHRDIKPHNLFWADVGQESRVLKILDFGLSRTESQPAVTATGEVLGTPNYMSPEHLMGGVIDARADIWSLAVVLYELMAGVTPFRMASQGETVARILSGRAAALESARGPVSASTLAVIAQCIQIRPEQRFSSIAEFAKALGANEPQRHAARVHAVLAAAAIPISYLNAPSALGPAINSSRWPLDTASMSGEFSSPSLNTRSALRPERATPERGPLIVGLVGGFAVVAVVGTITAGFRLVSKLTSAVAEGHSSPQTMASGSNTRVAMAATTAKQEAAKPEFRGLHPAGLFQYTISIDDNAGYLDRSIHDVLVPRLETCLAAPLAQAEILELRRKWADIPTHIIVNFDHDAAGMITDHSVANGVIGTMLNDRIDTCIGHGTAAVVEHNGPLVDGHWLTLAINFPPLRAGVVSRAP